MSTAIQPDTESSSSKGNAKSLSWSLYSSSPKDPLKNDLVAAEDEEVEEEEGGGEMNEKPNEKEFMIRRNNKNPDNLVSLTQEGDEIPWLTCICNGRGNENNKQQSVNHPYLLARVLGYGLIITICIILTVYYFYYFSNSNAIPRKQIQLKFRSKPNDDSYQYFKIVQITDIHLGEAENTDWGPLQDVKTFQALDTLLTMESSSSYNNTHDNNNGGIKIDIDLIVLSGDQLTSNDCQTNATVYYRQLGEFLSLYQVPWAMIFGNHDETNYHYNGQDSSPKYSRRDLMELDTSFPLSLSAIGPSNVTGTSNYVLDIYALNDETTLGAQVFFFDSGGGVLPEAIDNSQVEWFRAMASRPPTSSQTNTRMLPAVAFQHIPTMAHVFSETCQGYNGDGGIDALDYDAGIVEAIAETGRFSFLAVGHNHGNDYCCPYNHTTQNYNDNNDNDTRNLLYVCFGRHSGYGGYGKWARGVRVYELRVPIITNQKDPSSAPYNMQWRSWVRLESGTVVDEISTYDD